MPYILTLIESTNNPHSNWLQYILKTEDLLDYLEKSYKGIPNRILLVTHTYPQRQV